VRHLSGVQPRNVSKLLVAVQPSQPMPGPNAVDLAHKTLFAVFEVIVRSCIRVGNDCRRSQATNNNSEEDRAAKE
jgi:hypothetical protein